jgi:ABC-type uncharacterized transport system fused permease/ATPase subunit
MKSVLFVVFSFLLFSKKTALLKPKLSRTFFDSIEKRDKKRLEERALIIIIIIIIITSSSLLFEREKERERKKERV